MNAQDLVDRVKRLDRLFLDMEQAKSLSEQYPDDKALKYRWIYKSAKYRSAKQRLDDMAGRLA